MFYCHDDVNTCIAKHWTCNGEVDCPNGFDEKVELCNRTTIPVNNDNNNVLPKPEVTPATLTSMLTLLSHVIAQNQELSQEIARLNTVLTANTNANSAAMDRMEERLELMRNTQCP